MRMATIRIFVVSMSVLTFAGCAAKAPQSANLPAPVTPAGIAAPSAISPPNGAALTGHPRTIAFQWSPVKGATQYGIEIDCFGCCVADTWCADSRSAYKVQALKEPAFTFDFWGDQPGRWRVWAIGADRAPSGKSPWSEFTFAPVAKD
jgi:hypothetical protein